MAPGYSSEIIHFYVAEGLSQVGMHPEEDESITVERHGFDEVVDMIEENEIMDAKTITGVLSYLTRST
jgi:ADP-ribose pyrophosphatase